MSNREWIVVHGSSCLPVVTRVAHNGPGFRLRCIVDTSLDLLTALSSCATPTVVVALVCFRSSKTQKKNLHDPVESDRKTAGDTGRDAGGPAGQGQGLWKLEVARQVLAEDYGPRLDWVAVAKALDHERFNIPDQASGRYPLFLSIFLPFFCVQRVTGVLFFVVWWVSRKKFRSNTSLD